MNQVTTREVKEKDLPAIKEMVINTWSFYTEIFEDETERNIVVTQFLNFVLHDSSFGRVAVADNKVVGVMLGSANGEVPKFRMLQESPLGAFFMLGFAEEARKNFYDNYLSKYLAVLEQVLGGKEEAYDGSALFFAVSEEVRGMGVGKKLWNELKTYFRETNTKSIYLFTDTNCNFGFYDYNGFERVGEQEMHYMIEKDGKSEERELTILVYDYKL